MENNNDDYGYGYAPPEEKSPEEEFFHSVYIGGVERKNHIGVVEQAGKLHIRGVKYNLDEVCFIITHVKPVLVRKTKVNGKIKTACFSYQNTKPWKGSTGNICPSNRNDRDATPACNGCRAEVILAGLLCEKSGKPILNGKQPIFVFVRGRGVKSMNTYKYLDEIAKVDLPPIFPENPSLEKRIVKNKRYVTIVKKGTVGTDFWIKNVFEFSFGPKIDNKFIQKILKIQKETIPQFNEKFDWSVNIQQAVQEDHEQQESSGSDYAQSEPQTNQEESKHQEPQTEGNPSGFDFDDIPF